MFQPIICNILLLSTKFILLMTPLLVRKCVLRCKVHKIRLLWRHDLCFLEIYTGLRFVKIKVCVLRPSTQNCSFVCVCVPSSSYSVLSRICCFSWSSCFKLSTSTFSSMFWNKEKQESGIIIQHTRSAQNNLWLHKSFIMQQSGRILNIITLIFSHFNSSLEVKKMCLNIKGSVRTQESPQSSYVRPSSCCFGSCIVPPHFTLFALISPSLPSKRWV